MIKYKLATFILFNLFSLRLANGFMYHTANANLTYLHAMRKVENCRHCVVSESRCLPRSVEAPFLKVVRTNNGQFGGCEIVTPQVSQPLAY